MASAPRVSVILPTRNRARLLGRAVASVLAQTFRDFELIVIDDGSTDDTRAVLAAIADPRLRTLRRDEPDSCAGKARNVGLALARGEFVSFQDDDDVWLTQKLEKQVAALDAAGPQYGLCLCSFIRLRPQGPEHVGGAHYFGQLDYRRGIAEGGPDWSLIATPAWLVRRGALDEVGHFDERIRSWDDWELGLRLWRKYKFVHVDEPLYLQDHLLGGGLVKMIRARAGDLHVIMDKHAELWREHPDVLARHYAYMGRIDSLYRPAPAGRAELRHSLRSKPLQPKVWAMLGTALLGQRINRGLTDCVRRLRGFAPEGGQ